MSRLSPVGILIAVVIAGISSYALAETSDAYVPPRELGRPPWEYQLADVCVELESHSHWGECPVRLVTIAGDGVGVCACENAEPAEQDRRRFTVTEDEVLDLLGRLYNAYFFDMPSRYSGTQQVVVGEDGLARVQGTAVAGQKWRALTVTIGDYTKRVEARDSYPEELRELLGFIQEFAHRCIDQAGGRPSN